MTDPRDPRVACDSGITCDHRVARGHHVARDHRTVCVSVVRPGYRPHPAPEVRA